MKNTSGFKSYFKLKFCTLLSFLIVCFSIILFRFDRADFICSSSALASLLTLPFGSPAYFVKFNALAAKVDGKIYLRKFEGFDSSVSKNNLRNNPISIYQEMRTRQGLLLQQYLLSGVFYSLHPDELKIVIFIFIPRFFY